LEREVRPTARRSVRRVPFHINDPGFARAALASLEAVLGPGGFP
jgi:uncharacterized protein (UPF0261 family)